jgi:hypothetical protein
MGRCLSGGDRGANALRDALGHAGLAIHVVQETTSYPASAITRISSK